jgi:spore coat protein CotF
MDDKTIMANMLTSTKSLCDLMLHGSIESATPNVHNAFKLVLNDSLDMQNQIYSKMSEKGWYPAQNAEQKQINQTKKKYSTGA